MRSRMSVWLMCACVLTTTITAGAGDQVAVDRSTIDHAAETRARADNHGSAPRPEPVFSPTFQPNVEVKLNRAYSLAVDRVGRQPTCRSMFSQLGADGVEMLSSTLYMPASKKSESVICGGSRVAFTEVDTSVTKLCGRFGDVSDEKATVILLHEALHSAGLEERPHDPDAAMTAKQINSMVERRCGLRIR
jgi:hypothetical protein